MIGLLFATELRKTQSAGQFGLRSRDIGELVAFIVIGMITAVVLTWVALKSDRFMRSEVIGYGQLICLLAVLGIGVDMLQVFLKSSLSNRLRNVIHVITLIIEESGERVAMSLVCTYSFTILNHRRARS